MTTYTMLHVPKKQLEKYKKGHQLQDIKHQVNTRHHRKVEKSNQVKIRQAEKRAARSEMLLREDAGCLELEPDDERVTRNISQDELKEHADITSATKIFDLKLDKFGPYSVNYTRNGRHILMAGNKGHMASFDWQTKKLTCEFNVMETIQDVKWLHSEQYFAVAQKQWTYVYDGQGIELHCLKDLDYALRLQFLPYHYLLVSSSAKGYLSYVDSSMGKKVAGFSTGLGRLDVMAQNPSNAIINLGHANGTVTMWSPNNRSPLVKMLCHHSCTRAVAMDRSGMYMATSGLDRKMKIFDLRTFKPLYIYTKKFAANCLAFSDQGMLAAGVGNIVEVYKDITKTEVSKPYMSHHCNGISRHVEFCPFEDVLGVGHSQGFSSIIIPGSGEPNFDAFEANPYETKKQRRHTEVKMAIGKIPSEMITMDPEALGQVKRTKSEDVLLQKIRSQSIKLKTKQFTLKDKKRGRSTASKMAARKSNLKDEHKRAQLRDKMLRDRIAGKITKSKKERVAKHVLDRFKSD